MRVDGWIWGGMDECTWGWMDCQPASQIDRYGDVWMSVYGDRGMDGGTCAYMAGWMDG